MMESVPIGLQLGLAAGAEPSGAFMVLRGRDRAHVVASPFPPDTPPTRRHSASAMITAADEAVAVAPARRRGRLARRAEGRRGAARVRELIRAAG